MIYIGDCLETLRTLPSDSVDCIVTSPPYFGLRDYGHEGQLGLEKTPTEFVAKMVAVFEECRRVLKPEGTCWLNMGDSYCNSNGFARASAEYHREGRNDAPANDRKLDDLHSAGFKTKDMLGIPWRLAFALQDAGWYLRSDIIWHKPNPMPESVRDRPTKAHEYLFMLTKSQRYYYDADAIRTELAESSVVRLECDPPTFGGNKGCADNRKYSGNEWKPAHKNLEAKGQSVHSMHANRAAGLGEPEQLKGANARTVWTIPTVGFKEAHFATFPPELPKRCILAGCPEGGTVLDPFAGSGTTLMVAKQLGRKWIGIELNPEYAEMARRRIAAVTGSLFTVAEAEVE